MFYRSCVEGFHTISYGDPFAEICVRAWVIFQFYFGNGSPAYKRSAGVYKNFSREATVIAKNTKNDRPYADAFGDRRSVSLDSATTCDA